MPKNKEMCLSVWLSSKEKKPWDSSVTASTQTGGCRCKGQSNSSEMRLKGKHMRIGRNTTKCHMKMPPKTERY